MATPSILGVLGNPDEDLRKERALEDARATQFAQLTPQQAAVQAAYSGGAGMARGAGQILGGLTGTDVGSPAEKKAAAVERVRAKIKAAGINPNDLDAFYTATIKALGEEGLVAEAAAMAKEYQTEKRANRKSDLEDKRLARQERVDTLKDETDRMRIEALKAKVGPRADKLIQYVDAYNSASDPNTKAMLKQAIDNLTAGKGVTTAVANGLIQIIDKQTGEIVGETQTTPQEKPADEKKAKAANEAAKTAYAQTMAGLQQSYDAAVDLYNHPGLPRFIGPYSSRAMDPKATGHEAALAYLDKPGLGAMTKYGEVIARSFLDSIQQLKAASKTGSTGLGAVSDTEGKRLVDAAGALSATQDISTFKPELAKHVARIEAAVQRINEAAARHAGEEPVDVIQLRTRPLVGARRPAAAAPAATPAAPAAPVAPAAGGKKSLDDIFGTK